MMIKCPDCGLEYSYGRNICHICDDNTILFGSIFKEPRKAYNWNCRTNNGCVEHSLEDSNLSKAVINVLPERKDVKITEIL
ncbi:MAG: hypothetical protein ACFFE5_13685, partial [Candidatus Thorarchaeota archaeon]